MKIFEIREMSISGKDKSSHVAFVGGIDKTVDFIVSCCEGKVAHACYGDTEIKHVKRTIKADGTTDIKVKKITKKEIKEILKTNKTATFSHQINNCWYGTFKVINITIE